MMLIDLLTIERRFEHADFCLFDIPVMTEALWIHPQGTLVQAVKKGEWILLDEINLAAAEMLECLSGLLEGSAGSLVLLDRGDTGKTDLTSVHFYRLKLKLTLQLIDVLFRASSSTSRIPSVCLHESSHRCWQKEPATGH